MVRDEGRMIMPKNLSANFITRVGCKCKSEYKYHNKTTGKWEIAKNKCVIGKLSEPWCETQEKCGNNDNEKGIDASWDYCLRDKKIELFEGDDIYGKNYFKKNLTRIFLFIIVFVFIIPGLLFKFHFYEILEVYMPNFDLIATAMGFQDGILGTPYLQELYRQDSQNILGWGSALIVNYFSLLGLTYLVARRVKMTNSLLKGWAIGFVMLILTYLVPNIFITHIQNTVSDYIQQNFISKHDINKIMSDPSKVTLWPFGISNLIVILSGFIVIGLFISTEVFFLKENNKWLGPFVKNLRFITKWLNSG